MLIHAKIYWTDSITTILWNYALKSFVEQLNVLKVGDYGITPTEKFVIKKQILILKITTHGAVQFMNYMKDCK